MTMLCDQCSKEMETVVCSQCKGEIANLGPFCYLCGKELETRVQSPEDPGEFDLSDRVPCSDGSCVGIINEKGVCGTCGKPYTPET